MLLEKPLFDKKPLIEGCRKGQKKGFSWKSEVYFGCEIHVFRAFSLFGSFKRCLEKVFSKDMQTLQTDKMTKLITLKIIRKT